MKHLYKYRSFLFEQQSVSGPKDLSTDFIKNSGKIIPLPKEGQTYNLPHKVTCGYKATDCDELHAFQDTKKGDTKYDVGNMNMIVKEWLNYFYSEGINPSVTGVEVKVNGMQVDWTVTISESGDGKAWVGFTSRGAGCGDSSNDDGLKDLETRCKKNLKNGKINVEKLYPGCEIEEIKSHLYEDQDNAFKQTFFKYTNPKMPSQQNQQNVGTSTSEGTGEILTIGDLENLKSGDVLIGKRLVGNDGKGNPNKQLPGNYEIRIKNETNTKQRIIFAEVYLDGRPVPNVVNELNYPYESEPSDEAVLMGNMETGNFIKLRKS